MSEEIQIKKKSRFDWLDAIKALAITLVIFGHLGGNGLPVFTVYSSVIKLPLFFAASGFVFSEKKLGNFKAYFKNRLYRLILPYVIIAYCAGIGEALIAGDGFFVSLIDLTKKILTGHTFWFFPVLFITDILFYVLMTVTKKNDTLICVISAFCIAGAYFVQTPDRMLFMDINVIPVVLPMYAAGYILKKYGMKMKNKAKIISGSICLFIFIFLPAAMILFKNEYCYLNVYGCEYTNYPVNMIQAYTGIYSIFMLAPFFRIPKFISCLGRNTLFYYGYHRVLFNFIIYLIDFPLITPEIMRKAGNTEGRLIYIALTILTMILLVPMCWVVNRVFPFSVGLKISETNSVWKKIKEKKEIKKVQ